MKAWWQSAKPEEKKEEKKEGSEYELKPEDVKKQLDKIDGQGKDINEIKSKLSGLDDVTNYIREQREASARKKADEDKKKATETQTATDEEFNEEFLTDPANATRKIINDALSRNMSPLVESTVNTATRITMKEMFDNQPDVFEYANDPTIRREVESLVAGMPVKDRNNPVSITNCYYVAKGRHEAEIKEGKIKARTSAVSSSGSGTGGPDAKAGETVILTPEEKKAAAIFGLKEDDYAKAKKEMSYV